MDTELYNKVHGLLEQYIIESFNKWKSQNKMDLRAVSFRDYMLSDLEKCKI